MLVYWLLMGDVLGQVGPGMAGLVVFDIRWSGSTIGKVVVVSEDNASPPSGYSAGNEYWTWTSGPPWRGAFKLVPVGTTAPTYGDYTWKVFPNEHFDLSDTVSFPSISPDTDDGFWEVEVDTGASWVTRGYMWLIDGAPLIQEWYGVGLTQDLIGNGSVEIRFTSVEVPSPGSIEVYLLE
jgi:hypothetical protein